MAAMRSSWREVWGIICAMWRHGDMFSSSSAAWREDVAVRGRPAPITRSSCLCGVLEAGVGAMRLSVRKRTILGNSGSWFLERMDLLGDFVSWGCYRVGLLGLLDILKVVAESDVSWERWISVLSINA